MIQVLMEVEGLSSIKDKRRIVKSLKDKLINKYKLSVAEVDRQDSLRFIHLGGAYVSNSRQFGESVMQKAFRFVEENAPGRIINSGIMSEIYNEET